MLKFILAGFLMLSASLAMAFEVQDTDLEGKWVMVKMGKMDVPAMDDIWQFKDGQWTAISGGKALKSDPYTLKGDIIDLGYTKIKILEFTKLHMKTKQQGIEYTFMKQKD